MPADDKHMRLAALVWDHAQARALLRAWVDWAANWRDEDARQALVAETASFLASVNRR